MAAIRIKCFAPRCQGVPFAMNDGAARMAERMGRIHYKCDRCGSRWSITSADMMAKLDVVQKQQLRRTGRWVR